VNIREITEAINYDDPEQKAAALKAAMGQIDNQFGDKARKARLRRDKEDQLSREKYKKDNPDMNKERDMTDIYSPEELEQIKRGWTKYGEDRASGKDNRYHND